MWAMAVGKGGDSLGIMFVMKLIEGDAEAASKRRSSWSSTKDLKVCFCDFIKAEDLLNVVICCFRQSGPIYCRYVTTLQDQNFALPRPMDRCGRFHFLKIKLCPQLPTFTNRKNNFLPIR